MAPFLKSLLFVVFLGSLSHCTLKEKISPAPPLPPKYRRAINYTMGKNRRKLRDCYGKALLVPGNEFLKGKIYLSFDIQPSGSVKAFRVIEKKSTLKNKNIYQCLENQGKKWTFPKHSQKTNVSVMYPVHFSAHPPDNFQEKLDRFEKIHKKRKNQ